MGTTSDKLTYLNGTKQELKEAINNLGGSIDNETTFREYAQELDQIYDNIPKTTDTGTNLSLNTIKGKMNIIPKGDTSQNGTPTPDTPIDIEVVTGTQEVKVENVNLLPNPFIAGTTANGITLEILQDKKIKITGTATATEGVIKTLDNHIKLKANENYTFSVGTKQSGYGIYLQNANGTNLYYLGVSATNSYVTFTPNTDVEITKVSLHFPSGVVMNTTIYLQLEKGSTATPYQEHQEQTQIVSLGDIELCKIGNYQDYLYKSGDKWYKKERNSNELAKNMNVNSVTELGDYVRIQLRMSGTTFNNPSKSYCNYAIYKDGYSLQETHHYTYQNYLFLFIPKSELSSIDIAGATNYINTHTINVIYTLATPQDIEITNETLIEQLNNLDKMYSYNGVTNISSNGNLPIVLGVSALKGES